jgi:hypothetical protein
MWRFLILATVWMALWVSVSTQSVPFSVQDLSPGTASFTPDRIIPLKSSMDPRMLAVKGNTAYLIYFTSATGIWQVQQSPFPYTLLPGPTNRDDRSPIARDDQGSLSFLPPKIHVVGESESAVEATQFLFGYGYTDAICCVGQT